MQSIIHFGCTLHIDGQLHTPTLLTGANRRIHPIVARVNESLPKQTSTTLKLQIMKSINRAVFDFMDERMGIYVNPYNVEILLDEQDAISVSCHWPNEPMHKVFFIELEFASDTIAEFTNAFGITSLRHMGAINPALLMQLYLQGKAAIFSAIDTPPTFYSLHFRKRHNTTWATGENNVTQEVTVPLETPTQFFAYTVQQYQLAGKS